MADRDAASKIRALADFISLNIEDFMKGDSTGVEDDELQEIFDHLRAAKHKLVALIDKLDDEKAKR